MNRDIIICIAKYISAKYIFNLILTNKFLCEVLNSNIIWKYHFDIFCKKYNLTFDIFNKYELGKFDKINYKYLCELIISFEKLYDWHYLKNEYTLIELINL